MLDQTLPHLNGHPASSDALHRETLTNRMGALDRILATHAASGDLPYFASPTRAYLPVLSSQTFLSLSGGEPVHVVANGAAQLQNSLAHFNPDAGAPKSTNEQATLATTLLYTQPGDVLVFAKQHARHATAILPSVRRSLQTVGIEVADDALAVDSLAEWTRSNFFRLPIAPLVLEPEHFRLAAAMHEPGNDAALLRTLQANILAYTKDGAEKIWSRAGVPTPPTHYYSLTLGDSRISERIRADFSMFDELVMNRLDGSGGYGIFRQKVTTLREQTLFDCFGESDIQVQGYLELRDSPCVIALLGSTGVEVLLASSQRFKSFGTHSGNYWSRAYETELCRTPGFKETCGSALHALHRSGVRGHINIDLLIAEPEKTSHAGSPPQVYAREANIRPAGSSVLLRLKQGNINGRPIQSILLDTTVKSALSPEEAADRLAEVNQRTEARAVLLNARPSQGCLSIAFLDAGEAGEEPLKRQAQLFLSELGK